MSKPKVPESAPVLRVEKAATPVERATDVAIDAQLVDLAGLMTHLEQAPSHSVASIARDAVLRIAAIRRALS